MERKDGIDFRRKQKEVKKDTKEEFVFRKICSNKIAAKRKEEKKTLVEKFEFVRIGRREESMMEIPDTVISKAEGYESIVGEVLENALRNEMADEAKKDEIYMDKKNDVNANKGRKIEELYKLVKDKDVNRIVEEAVKYIDPHGKFAKKILEACREKRFCEKDIVEEKKRIEKKKEEVEAEYEKWKKIYEELKKSYKVMDGEKKIAKIEDIEHRRRKIERMREYFGMFNEKANKLKELEERINGIFEIADRKSKNIVKNVFCSLEKGNKNGRFLLKIMGRLGKS